jgi:hypothetical protein
MAAVSLEAPVKVLYALRRSYLPMNRISISILYRDDARGGITTVDAPVGGAGRVVSPLPNIMSYFLSLSRSSCRKVVHRDFSESQKEIFCQRMKQVVGGMA